MDETEIDGGPVWLKCEVSADAGLLEVLALLFTDLGSGGVEEKTGSVGAWFTPTAKEEVEVALTNFAQGAESPVAWEWSEVEKEDWWESWKKYFHPFSASKRLFVRPSWEECEPPAAGMVTLVVDPGRAFGTGAHETTRLCLNLIDEALLEAPSASMLDVGCGSGILSVAARLLGVPVVTAIDIDPLAVSATVENTTMNGVGDGILAARADVRAISGVYDLVVCNILYQIIMGIAPELVKRVAPGGRLILSGFLTPELEGVERMFGNLGLTVEKREEMGPWGVLALRSGH